MERTKTTERGRNNLETFATDPLEVLLAENARTLEHAKVFPSVHEETRALSMASPLSSETAFAWLGMILGALVPFSLSVRLFVDARDLTAADFWFLCLLTLANTVTSAVGYLTGATVARFVDSIKFRRWTVYITLAALTGFAWGAISGGMGGIFVFVIGGLPGAVLGSLAGMITLTVFSIGYRMLSLGNSIELRHFLPLAFGTVLSLSAFILGI